ncbi:MAG: hypothetical protein H7232_18075 [Aeromicrobium sp.]|nr:hypothetical protein [Burkholderiales bacterium]
MLIALAAAALSTAQTDTAVTLECDFNSGVFHAGSEKTAITSDKFQLLYDAIDARAGTARLIGNLGASEVKVIERAGRLTFIEVTASGNVTLTTVYRTGAAAPYPAIHSRHVGLLTEPWGSQMYGTCSPY